MKQLGTRCDRFPVVFVAFWGVPIYWIDGSINLLISKQVPINQQKLSLISN